MNTIHKPTEASLAITSVGALLMVPTMFVLGSSATVLLLAELFSQSFLSRTGFGVISAIIGELLAILYMILLGRKYGVNWKDTLFITRPTTKTILYGIAFGIGSFLLLKIVSIVLYLLGAEVSSSDTSTGLRNMAGFSKIIILGFFVPFVVPILEELLFRGAITSGLLGYSQSPNTKRIAWAVFGSSLLFSLAHYQGLSNFMDFFVLGWIFLVAIGNSFLRFKFDSIFVPIACHSTYNLLTALSMFFIK